MMFRIIMLSLCFITIRCHANDDTPSKSKIGAIGDIAYAAALFATVAIRDIPHYVATMYEPSSRTHEEVSLSIAYKNTWNPSKKTESH